MPRRISRSLVNLLAACLLLASPARAAVYPLPDADADVVGILQAEFTREGETLFDIGRRNGVGAGEMVAANPGIDPWVPGVNRRIVVPTRFVLPEGPRRGLVVNLAQMRLFYFPEARQGETRVVVTHPIGIGVDYDATPLGTTSVIRKQEKPTWHPPESIRKKHLAEGDRLPPFVPPGPDNPLGDYAMYLGFSGYLVHGTNRPWGIGMRVSNGCIRMYPEGIADLFARVAVGTAVRIIEEPYALGRLRGVPYLQVFPATRENDPQISHTPMIQRIMREIPRAAVDWNRVQRVLAQRRSIAEPIAPNAPTLSDLISSAELAPRNSAATAR